VSLPPLKRFLGLEEAADARTLLGLPRGPAGADAVRAALQRRLEDVDDHPGGRSVDAAAVRARLRAAADELLRAAPRAPVKAAPAPRDEPVRPGSAEATLHPRRPRPVPPATSAAPMPAGPATPARPAIRLTPFDQQVLAVLVASRGWNARARSRLVAMASAYGVSVQGLVKVVNGLSEYAKSGGPRLGVREITAGRSRMSGPPGAGTPAYEPPSSALMRKIAEQLDAERPGVRLRLAAVSALVTILAGVLVVWMVVPRDRGGAPRPAPVTGPPSAPGQTATAQPARPVAESPSSQVFTARFARIPTFTGNAVPQAAVLAADESARVVDQMDRLARQLNVDPTLSIRDARDWADAVTTAGTGWVLIDESTRRQMGQLAIDAVYVAADEPEVSDALLAELTPELPGMDPLDIWRGAWRAGTLAEIAGSGTLPPVVVEQARRQLASALGVDPPAQGVDFVFGADLWLRSAIAHLVSITEFDDAIEDRWELWIAAQRELGGGERYDDAMLDVLEATLAAPADLARQGPSARLMGRMLLLIRFTDGESARRRVVSWFDDPRMNVSDLWVLTSLMSLHDRTPWFGNDLVLPIDADPAMRRRIADLIARRWEAVGGPAPVSAPPEGRGVAVDAVVLQQWREAVDRFDAALAARGHGIQQLAAAARLNSAAALLAADRVPDARQELQSAEDVLAGEPLSLVSTTPPGQPIGTDGVWAGHYEEAGRNLEQRLTRLRSLRSSAGTDLGPVDAAVLVQEAVRGAPSEVRSLAQAIIVESFSRGPAVALELVNQVADAPPNEWLSELIVQLTGRDLPSIRAASWSIEARRALTEHALALRPSSGPPTDAIADIVTDAYTVRLERFGRTLPVSVDGSRAPHDVAEELALQWQRAAATVMARVEVPADLESLERRHVILRRLARGPIRAFVAAQLAILDLLAYQTVAEQPARGAEVAALLGQSQQRRDATAHVIEQAVEAERAMTGVWAVRLVSDEEANP
jgi:hypothetical protein